MASQRRVLYIGVTGNLHVRVWQHKFEPEGFVARYQTNKLVFFESYADVRSAIDREKELKGWRRERKIALIESVNPKWRDLSDGWYVRPVARRPKQTL
jgi:putative endonuclease